MIVGVGTIYVISFSARCTVKAATYVECQVLDKTKFIKMMITYPQMIDKIKHEIGERIERSRRRKHTQGRKTTVSLNIYASKDRKKSSIKCLKDKLRYIQGNKMFTAWGRCIFQRVVSNRNFMNHQTSVLLYTSGYDYSSDF